MKTIKYLILTLLGVFALAVSCSDDKELVPVWETGINGEGLMTGASSDFRKGDNSVKLDVGLKWISVDSKATATKIEVFLTFKENYVDIDGNPAVANHGTKLFKTFEGAAVPANREAVNFSVSQDDVYALFNGVTYDYKDGVDDNAIDVFAAPFNTDRNAVDKFLPEDKFQFTWQFTGDDGRVFKAWSPSTCTEFPESNCQLDFGVVCATEITDPGADGGAWTIDMTDVYGDGWQGFGHISVKVDGVETNVFIPDKYEAPPEGSGGVGIGALQTIINVPPGATTLTFTWVKGEFDEENTFKITSPRGNIVANVSGPTEGLVKLDLCKD